MGTFLLLVGLAMIVFVILPRKKRKNSTGRVSPPPEPIVSASGKDAIKVETPAVADLEEYEDFELSGVHISGRKKYILDNCSEDDHVVLFRDSKNPVNRDAIGVKHERRLIGYIYDNDLAEVGKIMLSRHQAHITEIEYDGSHLKVEIGVEYASQPVLPKPRRSKKRKLTGAAADPDYSIGQEEIINYNMNRIPSEYLRPKKEVEDSTNFFYGKKVCISGVMDSFPIRPELAEHLWNLGADIDTGVGKTCDILICGTGVGPTKLKNAQAQGVHMMDEEELLEKLKGFKSKYV